MRTLQIKHVVSLAAIRIDQRLVAAQRQRALRRERAIVLVESKVYVGHFGPEVGFHVLVELGPADVVFRLGRRRAESK